MCVHIGAALVLLCKARYAYVHNLHTQMCTRACCAHTRWHEVAGAVAHVITARARTHCTLHPAHKRQNVCVRFFLMIVEDDVEAPCILAAPLQSKTTATAQKTHFHHHHYHRGLPIIITPEWSNDKHTQTERSSGWNGIRVATVSAKVRVCVIACAHRVRATHSPSA